MDNRRWYSLLLAIALPGALSCASLGCSSRSETKIAGSVEAASPSPEPALLNVGAAVAVQDLLEETAARFEEESNCRLVFNFSNMGILQAQVENGAQTDVFVSTSVKNMDALISGGYISAEATATLASDELAIIVAAGNPGRITGPDDLVGLDIITTGDPGSTAQGAKAQEWLTNIGMWNSLQSKFLYAANALQICSYISGEDVRAGIGFSSNVADDPTLEIAYRVPPDEIKPIRYVAAPVLGSDQPRLAAAYVTYLQSEAFREAVKAHGLHVPQN